MLWASHSEILLPIPVLTASYRLRTTKSTTSGVRDSGKQGHGNPTTSPMDRCFLGSYLRVLRVLRGFDFRIFVRVLPAFIGGLAHDFGWIRDWRP